MLSTEAELGDLGRVVTPVKSPFSAETAPPATARVGVGPARLLLECDLDRLEGGENPLPSVPWYNDWTGLCTRGVIVPIWSFEDVDMRDCEDENEACCALILSITSKSPLGGSKKDPVALCGSPALCDLLV